MIESSNEGGNVSTEAGSEEEGSADKVQAGKAKEMSTLASAELVFPLVIAGIPKNYLPLCSPKSHSLCHFQVPQCNLDFSQKATVYNHVQCDHLNVALTCLYCSFEDDPKMYWYSATAWEYHTMKHLKDNLLIFPDDPAFSQKFILKPSGDTAPSTSKQMLPNEEEVRK